MRKLAFAATVLGVILVFLLASASSNTALFAEHYPWLLGINALIAIFLVGLVATQLHRLYREYRADVFGSRLKLRLLLMLALMAVLPGVLVYAVSVQFAVRSIESWFDVRVDSALEGGLNLGRSVLENLQSDLSDKANAMALDLGDPTLVRPPRLNRLREQAGVQTATLLTPAGQVLASSSSEIGSILPPMPTPAQLRQARQGHGTSMAEGDVKEGILLRALAPARSTTLLAEPYILQLTQPVPRGIASSAESVEAAYREYQQLQLGRDGLKRIYTLTLTLTLLLSLFAAIALAFFLAERLARPLLILVEGTRAVAAGDFAPRATLESNDELGVLTQSFNQMTRQLADARHDADQHRAELEAARAYLESVLANLSAGVLAFNTNYILRAANRGALTILKDDLNSVENLPLPQWPSHRELCAAVEEGFSAANGDWHKQLEIDGSEGVPQTLLIRGTTLPELSGGGYVVVFDDITHLIAAQRSAAWGEVARRLAHEIKNPLTPIQLSAERLQHKLADKLDDASRNMLERATQTIVNQVEAMKNMVNDFRDYARTPPPVLAAVDLNSLVGDVLGLYENAHVSINTELGTDLPLVLADPNQMRQVIHNLLANAQDALGEATDGRISLKTWQNEKRVSLSVTDTGSGFPPNILARAFEPYVTTKAKGTGLGLAIVKKIIDEHRGEIKLANLEGGGAMVSISLPNASSTNTT